VQSLQRGTGVNVARNAPQEADGRLKRQLGKFLFNYSG